MPGHCLLTLFDPTHHCLVRKCLVFFLYLSAWLHYGPLPSAGSYPSPKAGATLVMYKDLLVLFGGWTRPSPYPLHQPERFFDEIHTYSPSKNWWVKTSSQERVCYGCFIWFSLLLCPSFSSSCHTFLSSFWPPSPTILFFSPHVSHFNCVPSPLVQVELHSDDPWPPSHGWALFISHWQHHGGVWRLSGRAADVRKTLTPPESGPHTSFTNLRQDVYMAERSRCFSCEKKDPGCLIQSWYVSGLFLWLNRYIFSVCVL